jgi:hypothetical protein
MSLGSAATRAPSILARATRRVDPVVLGGAAVALYIGALTVRNGIEAMRGTTTFPNNDAVAIGTALAKEMNPALFSRDYAYHDLSLWGFYTPFPLWLMKVLWNALGSYELALSALMPVLLGVYVLGMYRLTRLITGNRWVGLGVAVISTAPRLSIGSELWGIAGATTVGPRTLFWAASPWLFWLVSRRPTGGWRLGLLIGLVLGIMTNLHPVSGLAIAETLGLLAVAAAAHWRSGLAQLAGLGVGAILGGLPMLFTFLRGLRGAAAIPPGISFDRFASLLHERLVTLFPHKQPRYPFVDMPGVVAPAVQELAAWGYLLFLVAMAIAAWRASSSGRDLTTLWGLVWMGQAPVLYLITGRGASGGMALILVATVYPLLWRLDAVDKLLARLLVIMTALWWLGSYGLVRVWELTHAWSLTTVTAEHSRGARFVYLPLYLILGRMSARLLADHPRRVEAWGIVLALWAGVFWAPGAPLGVLVALAVAWWSRRPVVERRPWWPAVSSGAVAGALVWPVAYRLLPPRLAPVPVLLAALLAAAWSIMWRYRPAAREPARRVAIPLALTGVLAAGLVWPAGLAWAWTMLGPQSLATLGQTERDMLGLTAWAREHTPEESLFFFGHPGDVPLVAREGQFRFRAQRSITHSWKDIGVAYYVRRRMVEFHERYHALERARRDPAKLLSCARALGADYVVLASRGHDLGIAIAYRNPTYTVYQLSGPARDASQSGPWALPADCR